MASIKDLKRMCEMQTLCADCPLNRDCSCMPDSLPDNADEIVDKWVLEYPDDCRVERLEKNIMAELKPCPFCGEKPDNYLRATTEIDQTKIVMYITCCKCRIEKSTYVQGYVSFERLIEAHEKLIKDWNTRAGE